MVSQKPFIITIDGPAGSGKSTVSAKLAKRLRLVFLTTGTFYRGLGLLCREKAADITDAGKVAQWAQYQGFVVRADVYGTQLFIDDVNRSEELNSEQVALVASRISAYPEVRAALLELQRAFNKAPGLIAEGRDCGTVVFPQADVKIFLTASLDTRAQRRSSENKVTAGQNMAQTISNRDQADTSRKTAPLTKASDTVEIDSSSLSIDEVVDRIIAIVDDKKAAAHGSKN